jgi:Tol biopolymer transport system component
VNPTPGTRLGPYQILAPLGAGGMGEVYRARDTRLGRDVAIKVLSPHLAATPEVRARFEREARTISQLNHPHICTLYDVGHQDGTDYLVMELLEGETLAHRLEKGPLPVAEVLTLGTQIADALDRAHRAGVVHRDLKPGNVMLTKAGAKLMDFGLARAAGLGAAPGTLTESPTVSRPLTAEGTIVGTFQYMAPEQLEGKEADARSDLWALGCVLYEMATGKRAFEGQSQASLIVAIMEHQPRPLTELQPLSPPALEHVVTRCLTKDADERWQSARDVMHELQWIAAAGSQAGVPAPVAARRRGGNRIAWALAGALALSVVALGSLVLRLHVPPRVVRFDVHPPKGTTDMGWPRVSPDGQTLAFLASDSTGTARLWIRSLNAIEARPLGETELQSFGRAARPFWAPDGKYLAFIAKGRLRKVPVAGGPVIDICDASGGADGTWGRSGWILFDGGPGDPIRGVPASGGAPQPITYIDQAHGETGHGWPFFLPDGRHFLFTASRAGSLGEIRLGTLGSKGSRLIGHTKDRAEYASPGYLVFDNGGVLMAQPFDAHSTRTTGEPVPIGEKLGGEYGDFSVSSGGVLAYEAEPSQGETQLLWVARDGHSLGEVAPPGPYEEVALSPDGIRLAVKVAGDQPATRDIWVRDLSRHVSSRLTFSPSDEGWPVWSPDGTRIAYVFDVRGASPLMIQAANGVGVVDSVAFNSGNLFGLYDWSGAANTILFGCISASSGIDIWAMPLDAPRAARPLLQSPFDERSGRLSPDGRWLAYSSDESGRDEVCVVSYPHAGGKWQVSTAGGGFPQWRADGKELFFQGADESIMAAAIGGGPSFEAGAPKFLFKIALARGFGACGWAVSRDGQRFVVNAAPAKAAARHLVVVTNWTSELRRR